MSFVAVAVGGGALLGAGASLAGASKQSKAAGKAADLQMGQFDTLTRQQQPFIQGGVGANTRLMELLGIQAPDKGPLSFAEWSAQHPSSLPTTGKFGKMGQRDQQIEYDRYVQGYVPPAPGEQPDDFGSLLRPFDAETFEQYQDPGYLFRKQQGEQSVLNSASAGSGSLTGSALKDLLSFNSDLASTEYNNAFNRYQTQQGNIFQRLSGLTQLGQNAAANVGAQGTAAAGNAGANIASAGAAAGAGIVGAGNAISQGATNYWLSNMLKPAPAPVAVGP